MARKEIWFQEIREKKDFAIYAKYKNKLLKTDIITHLQKQNYCISGNETPVYEIFNNKQIGIDSFYKENGYFIPCELVYYLKHYDIGIPYEYEEYLINECGLKPKERENGTK